MSVVNFYSKDANQITFASRLLSIQIQSMSESIFQFVEYTKLYHFISWKFLFIINMLNPIILTNVYYGRGVFGYMRCVIDNILRKILWKEWQKQVVKEKKIIITIVRGNDPLPKKVKAYEEHGLHCYSLYFIHFCKYFICNQYL